MRIAVTVVVAFVAFGCTSKNLQPVSEMTEGERLYRANCAACHALRNPANYTDDEWTGYVAKYGEKLNLSAQEQEKILAHLQSANN